MGISCDAQICFGVDIGEDWHDVLPWAGDDDYFDDWVARICGADSKPLWDEYYAWEREYDGDPPGHRGKLGVFEEAHPEWREKMDTHHRFARAFVNASPIEEVLHGYPEPGCRIVAVRGTVKRVYLGDAMRLDESDLWTPDVLKLQLAAAFCKEHGIPWEEPSWLLSVWYSY